MYNWPGEQRNCQKNGSKTSRYYQHAYNLLQQQSAPDVDLDFFDENALEYHDFLTLFHDLVEKGINDPRGR